MPKRGNTRFYQCFKSGDKLVLAHVISNADADRQRSGDLQRNDMGLRQHLCQTEPLITLSIHPNPGHICTGTRQPDCQIRADASPAIDHPGQCATRHTQTYYAATDFDASGSANLFSVELIVTNEDATQGIKSLCAGEVSPARVTRSRGAVHALRAPCHTDLCCP